jgi:hypothetical protein
VGGSNYLPISRLDDLLVSIPGSRTRGAYGRLKKKVIGDKTPLRRNYDHLPFGQLTVE